MTLLEWAKIHQCYPKKNQEDMGKIISTLEALSEEKKQNSDSTGKQLPVNGSNKTPEKNNTTFWSEHKWKIALSVVGLCTAGAIAAYMLAYPAVALALTVLATVILIGAGIDKFCEKSESPNTKISDQGVSSYANEKIAY